LADPPAAPLPVLSPKSPPPAPPVVSSSRERTPLVEPLTAKLWSALPVLSVKSEAAPAAPPVDP
jgi:hypothetical protein